MFNKNGIIVTAAMLLLMVSCSNEPDRALVISKLKNSSKLATVEYIVTKVTNYYQIFFCNTC